MNAPVSSRAIIQRQSMLLLLLTLPVLLALFAWASNLEANIATLRLSSVGTQTNGEDHLAVIYPGTHGATNAPLTTEGEWLEQPLGDHLWIASSEPGSSISFQFYGTEASILARVGPESGRVYVTIDGESVAGLDADDMGTFVNLRTSRAANRIVPLATGLAHREHQLTMTKADADELALAELIIEARNPFPWAFAMIYVATIAGVLLIVRQIAIQFARGRGWLPRVGPLLIPSVPSEEP